MVEFEAQDWQSSRNLSPPLPQLPPVPALVTGAEPPVTCRKGTGDLH